jgi:hypothetical protein
MSHAQGAFDFKEVSSKGFVAGLMHGLGDPSDPSDKIVEIGHGTGEHCTLIVHPVSLPEASGVIAGRSSQSPQRGVSAR